MKISTVPLNLKETISEVIRALRYTHRERDLDTIEDLERVPPELVVLGDPVRLHQIFMNLLSNSYKFTPKGSITVKAKVAREGKGRVRLECSVSDTGIGIPEEQKARLFRPFSQADPSTERSYGGSGLGLSICKAIIEDVLGGAIWLDSESGIGTTVTFHLVFNKAPKKTAVKAAWSQDLSQTEHKEEAKAKARDLTQIPRDQIKVCIAEDNPINQKIAVKFVNGLGLYCEAYSDGKQAVDALRAKSKEGNPFHIVLMDVMMPTLDGYNATRELRRDPDPNVNEVLVIAMTASAIEGDREKCLEAGMNNYLPKPVRSPILSELLDKYLAPVPSHPRTRLAIRQKGSRGSIGPDAGTPTSFSSSGSDDIKHTPFSNSGGK
jgi:CheY-like chemotaxis protein/two-component sensor histidine kinase